MNFPSYHVNDHNANGLGVTIWFDLSCTPLVAGQEDFVLDRNCSHTFIYSLARKS